MMRAVTVVPSPDGKRPRPEALVVAEVPAPVCGPGDVLIRVAAAGVNRPDVLQRMVRRTADPVERGARAGCTHQG
jgi:NADPH:quinone reductase-like Zn-dependent oxidoreductase